MRARLALFRRLRETGRLNISRDFSRDPTKKKAPPSRGIPTWPNKNQVRDGGVFRMAA
jgi:hypothetical protein